MRDEDQSTGLRRGIRRDLVIGVCALVISFAATAASWWQSRVVADQLSAQVWPYLSIDTSYDARSVNIDVVNNGLGPALVRSTVFTLDGKPVADPLEMLRRLNPRPSHLHFGIDMNSLGRGAVIRASGDRRILQLNGTAVVREFIQNEQRIDVTICYCSLLKNCWRTSANATSDPTPLPNCPDVGKEQFKAPVFIPT